MTLQETFNIVAKHLLTQNAKASIVDSADRQFCRYRTDAGLKCAAGCLISDEDYHPSMENKPVHNGRVAPAVEKHGHNINLVRCLQQIHDFKEPADWKYELNKLAQQFELKGVA